MKDSSGVGFDGRDAVALLALGAVAGALATYLVQSIQSELPAGSDPASGVVSGGDWLRKAAQRLQENCDRLVESIEKGRDA